VAVDIENVRKNSKLLINKIPFNVDDVEFMKPGKGRAIYRLKLRNLFDNSTIDSTYHSGDKVEVADVTSHEIQYLYNEGDHYVFMDTESFEQYFISNKIVGDKKNYLKDGTIVTGLMMDKNPIDVTLPNFVELKVVESAMSTRTDTITAQNKSVVMETGLNMGVPPFIKEGDIIKVDTRTGVYVERITVKK
jgi:elongation factor P